jgi:murein DD-endopeptidase MepM/ murein hydrolase activator NlpD
MHLAGLAAALSFVAYPTHAFDYNLAKSVQSEVVTTIVMTTNSEYQFPLEMTIGMSQSYHGLHPGVDLRAPRGTKILSMAEGTVVEVEEMFVGYGHFVRIAHKGTISSLYAHLDQVKVHPGQKVTKGEVLGTVGMTGWTTGPHLHFEVHSGEKSVNPLGYITK